MRVPVWADGSCVRLAPLIGLVTTLRAAYVRGPFRKMTFAANGALAVGGAVPSIFIFFYRSIHLLWAQRYSEVGRVNADPEYRSDASESA